MQVIKLIINYLNTQYVTENKTELNLFNFNTLKYRLKYGYI